VDIASRLGSTPQLSSLLRALALTPGDPGLRAAAARADIAATPDEEAVVAYGAMLADAREPWSVREAAGTALARKSSEAARGAVLLALQAAPGRVQAAWTRAIAETPRGPALLLDAAADGSLPPARLLDPAVRDRIRAAAPPDWERRMESATRGLPSEDAAREKLVAARRVGFAAGAGRAEEGRRVFDTHCAACHQIDGRGGLVGPQLAGIGNRGVERLCEDILDPNRNVDHAFRQSLLTLKDGETLPGLFRREEGDLLVLADATGREFTVPKSDVAKREESPLSPMPDNFGEAIPTADFDHLLAFLLSRR
jgi:putative heme-binding domain-containing protein